MGLLDDAIREHLDLKRRRGADPDEVERAEREALGPVRRGPEPAETPDTEVEHEDDVAAYDLHDEPDWDDVEAEDQVPHAPAPAPLDQPVSASEPFLEEEFDQPAPAPTQHLGDETAEYNIEEALEHEHHSEHQDHSKPETEHDSEQDREPASDDMLEETPEFLQDAPDHDRLWFEQRPPRDFKFDS